ncbi:xyloside xylosyltransferase 1 [Caerostris extrusa]|uniref:Xyloside xylosyltransferase 1 n=1 Tax=Caerostris extrusa TaxID=172846 RepID=A0AAV4R8L8_CAEEX|nr:xyloside xylosyltransferase 1 [Caerostris extrusa]
MKIVRGMAKTFYSILQNTHHPVYLHVLLDNTSKMRTARTLRKVAVTFRRRLNVTYYDVNDMANQNREAISTIRKYFFSKDVGKYNDDIFFPIRRLIPRIRKVPVTKCYRHRDQTSNPTTGWTSQSTETPILEL